MGEEYQGGICGGNWWSSSRNVLVAVGGLSSCSMGIADLGNYGCWPLITPSPTDDFLDIKPTSSHINTIPDNGSLLFHDNHPKPPLNSDSISNNLLIDSTLQIMGFPLSSSSSSSDWNQSDLLFNDQIRKDWSPEININGGMKQAQTDDDYFLDQNQNQNHRIDSINCSSTTTTPTCQDLSLSSANCFDSNFYGYPSKLLHQNLYHDPESNQSSALFNSNNNNHNFCPNSNPNLPSYLKPSLPKLPLIPSALNFTNNTPFWNASAVADSTDIQQGLVSILEEKNLKPNGNSFEDGQDHGSVVKKSEKNNMTEPVFKRPRIETPSPLPTFKVRKEKLGDRVTALQQLVSPFGKTDTASVLHEAIEYIKFLHDQVLSTPYMKSNNVAPIQSQQATEKLDPDSPKQDLRSRGLCLVPISSTFPVTNATTHDFWTPTFGGTFR